MYLLFYSGLNESFVWIGKVVSIEGRPLPRNDLFKDVAFFVEGADSLVDHGSRVLLNKANDAGLGKQDKVHFLKINLVYFQFSDSQFSWQIWQTNNGIKSNKPNRIKEKA